jgi:hypothetical protein
MPRDGEGCGAEKPDLGGTSDVVPLRWANLSSGRSLCGGIRDAAFLVTKSAFERLLKRLSVRRLAA